MTDSDPMRKDLSISTLKAQLLSVVVGFPVAGIQAAVFGLVWGAARLTDAFKTALSERMGWALLLILAGILFHELLHGLGWILASRKGWETVSFGFQLKTLTPYAHIDGRLTVRAYRLGTAFPLLVLGLLPWMAALLLGNPYLNLFGLVFTMLSAGDLMALWLLRRAKGDQNVQDHPSRVGVYLYSDQE